MPIAGAFLGLNTIWFDHALASSEDVTIDGELVRVVSAAGLIATKFAAFKDRGDGDYFGSHDIEDLISVVDGRERIVEDVATAPVAMRDYVVEQITCCLNSVVFREALAGHLPSDAGCQARLPKLVWKLERIRELE